MGPLSPLAREYSKAIKKRTPTGLTAINRKIFVEVYAEIRPNSLSERAIRAGWKRTGLYPSNKQRILADPEVNSFGRTTPEYQPPAAPEGPNGLFSTPKKFEAFRALISTIEATTTPTTRRRVEKLGNAAIQEYTGSQLLMGELKQLRQLSVNTERAKRTKRL